MTPDWITQALVWRGYCTLEARIRASHEAMDVCGKYVVGDVKGVSGL